MAEPLPTFLIIGAQKSATRWLRLNLGLHPEVFTAERELSFFNSEERFAEGPDAYASLFEGWAGERIVGEATPGYMMYRHQPKVVAGRIAGFRPDMRLLAVLRNPVDRTYSAFVHHMRKGRIPPDADLMEHVRGVRPKADPLGLIAGGWYTRSLRPFRRRFGDGLQVVLHDDVQEDPVGVYGRALRHVGASPDFLPPDLEEVRFGNTPPAESGLRDATGGYKPLDEEQRRELHGFFKGEIRRLESFLGRDLSAWKLGAPARSATG